MGSNGSSNQIPIIGTGLEQLGGGRISNVPYESERFYQKEKEIWQDTWLVAARESDLQNPGDFVTFDIKVSKKPLIIVRGKDGELRAFYNVCSHRCGRILGLDSRCSKGNTGRIRCQYHSWTYTLEGKLIGIPEQNLFKGLESKEDMGLKPVHLNTWGGFVFVNTAPEPQYSLAESLRELPEALADYLADPEWIWYSGFQTNCASNWKDAINIQHEGYHATAVHVNTLGVQLKAEDSRVTLFPNSPGAVSLMTVNFPSRALPRKPTALETCYHQYMGRRIADVLARHSDGFNYENSEDFGFECITLFPNFMISLYAGVMAVMRTWPDGPHNTILEWDFYHFGKAEKFSDLYSREFYRVFNRNVLAEDWVMVEQAHNGLVSGAVDGTHIAGDMEATVRAFHEHLIARLGLTEEQVNNEYA